MAVTVFLFILLLGGVAGKINTDIEGLTEHVQKQCEGENPTPQTSASCQNFANSFSEETRIGPGCTSAGSSSVDQTYKNTLSLLSPRSGYDTMLLWSGPDTGDRAANNKDSKTTLGMTLAGKSLHNLHWTKTGASVDTLKWYYSEKPCHSYRPTVDCEYPLEYLYWDLASKKFAAQARGHVEVYLTNKTIGGPYAKNSIFRKYEVPNLTSGVTKLTVKLFDIDTCNIPDITTLCNDLAKRSITNCKCEIGTSKLAVTGNYRVTGTPYWRPDGTCDSCTKLPSVITIIIPILTLLLKS